MQISFRKQQRQRGRGLRIAMVAFAVRPPSPTTSPPLSDVLDRLQARWTREVLASGPGLPQRCVGLDRPVGNGDARVPDPRGRRMGLGVLRSGNDASLRGRCGEGQRPSTGALRITHVGFYCDWLLLHVIRLYSSLILHGTMILNELSPGHCPVIS